MSIIFDTLEYAKGAEAVGIPRVQAEFQAERLAGIVNDQNSILVTRQTLKHALADLRNELVIKLGALMVVCSGAIVSLLGFIIKH
jgi:hypothetical protein